MCVLASASSACALRYTQQECKNSPHLDLTNELAERTGRHRPNSHGSAPFQEQPSVPVLVVVCLAAIGGARLPIVSYLHIHLV